MNNAVRIFNNNAALYHEKFGDVSLYEEGLNILCQKLPAGAALLDIACGPGNVTRYLLDHRPDLNILGADLAPAMVAIAEEVNPEASFTVMDSGHISQLQQKFHAVVCAFLLPYLSAEETAQLMEDIVSVSADGGLLYLSAMVANEDNVSGIRTSSKGDKLFMHYHQEEFVEGLVTAHGFSLLYKTIIEYTGPDGTKTSDLVLVAQKS